VSGPDFLLTQRLSHIERLVDAIDLPIGRWDRDARLVFCNNPYLGWAERPREELIGRSLQELYGDEAWRRAAPAFAEAFAGRTVNYERRLTHGRKSSRWARVQVFPDLDLQGRVEAVFTIAFDIHEDVLAREALEAARERLDRFTENIPYPASCCASSTRPTAKRPGSARPICSGATSARCAARACGPSTRPSSSAH
jgi:PAS domain S-box-containing protein